MKALCRELLLHRSTPLAKAYTASQCLAVNRMTCLESHGSLVHGGSLYQAVTVAQTPQVGHRKVSPALP